MLLHPRIRLPLLLAVILPVAAYAYRSIVLRGGDWRPDLPWDVVAFLALAILIGLVAWMRRSTSDRDDAYSDTDSDRSP
ncbi:MAG: hypothetical protein HY876_07475 [Coriobacteriales bacterium]|nr:hypothetical protein [Coriobacteriales bacterium]